MCIMVWMSICLEFPFYVAKETRQDLCSIFTLLRGHSDGVARVYQWYCFPTWSDNNTLQAQKNVRYVPDTVKLSLSRLLNKV